MKYLCDLTRKIRGVRTELDLEAVIRELSYYIGFEYYLMGISVPQSITNNATQVLHNYPKSWRLHYDEAQYVVSDPVIQKSRKNHEPLVWRQLSVDDSLSRESKIVLKESESYGLYSGFSLPMHFGFSAVGVLSFALSEKSTHNEDLICEALPIVQVVLPLLQDAVVRIGMLASREAQFVFTPRETETLTWVMEGKSTWEIAKILGRSERTVEFHLTNAIEKIGAVNRYQAISKALLLGVIQPKVY